MALFVALPMGLFRRLMPASPTPLAGGLSFLDATPDTSTCALESIPAWTDLGTGATLRGSFELSGGTLTVLDEDGNPTTLISEGFALRGCFSLPAESYALELDE